MAGRNKGLMSVSGNFEPQMSAPLDARDITNTKSDLTNSTNWTANDGQIYAYVGMKTTVVEDPVAENNGIYLLKALDFSNINNWEKISNDSSLTTIEISDVNGLTTELIDIKDRVVNTEAEIENLENSLTLKQDVLTAGKGIFIEDIDPIINVSDDIASLFNLITSYNKSLNSIVILTQEQYESAPVFAAGQMVIIKTLGQERIIFFEETNTPVIIYDVNNIESTAVTYVSQNLNNDQKTQARSNIDAFRSTIIPYQETFMERSILFPYLPNQEGELIPVISKAIKGLYLTDYTYDKQYYLNVVSIDNGEGNAVIKVLSRERALWIRTATELEIIVPTTEIVDNAEHLYLDTEGRGCVLINWSDLPENFISPAMSGGYELDYYVFSKANPLAYLYKMTDGVEEAPNDNKQYARQDETWQEIDAYLKTESDAKYQLKEEGKGLSTNDFTSEEKTKLSELGTNVYILPEGLFTLSNDSTESEITQTLFGTTDYNEALAGFNQLIVDVSKENTFCVRRASSTSTLVFPILSIIATAIEGNDSAYTPQLELIYDEYTKTGYGLNTVPKRYKVNLQRNTGMYQFSKTEVATEFSHNSSYTTTFTSASLTSNILNVNHALNSDAVVVSVYDESRQLAMPTEIQIVDSNNITIDFTSIDIVGTWQVVVLASGGESGGGTNDHNTLINRDISNQHTIGAITGLTEEVEKISVLEATKQNASSYEETPSSNPVLNLTDNTDYKCTSLINSLTIQSMSGTGSLEFATSDTFLNSNFSYPVGTVFNNVSILEHSKIYIAVFKDNKLIISRGA